MKEVGTTNITSLNDYQSAISNESSTILVIHPSNYKLYGHTSKPDIGDIVNLAHSKKLIVIEDLGSGALLDFSESNLATPSIHKSIEAGVDLISFSGDKLLGGPQAGILVGRAELITSIKKNPLLRPLRIDKLSLAALLATLKLYFPPNNPKQDIPTLKMIFDSLEKVREKINLLSNRLESINNIQYSIEESFSYSGGGSLPTEKIPSMAIKIKPLSISANSLTKKLRESNPPIISRINSECVYLDLRTVREDQVEAIYESLNHIFN
tara:strand:- start:673 stop:1473 length:801 start_codon:yes stop_codon:yes gene_type:complete